MPIRRCEKRAKMRQKSDREATFVDTDLGERRELIVTALTRGVLMVAHWKKKHGNLS